MLNFDKKFIEEIMAVLKEHVGEASDHGVKTCISCWGSDINTFSTIDHDKDCAWLKVYTRLENLLKEKAHAKRIRT